MWVRIPYKRRTELPHAQTLEKDAHDARGACSVLGYGTGQPPRVSDLVEADTETAIQEVAR